MVDMLTDTLLCIVHVCVCINGSVPPLISGVMSTAKPRGSQLEISQASDSSSEDHLVEDDQRRWTKQGSGEVVESEDTILEGVPIVTPNKDVVVGSLSFEVNVCCVCTCNTA